MLREKFNTVCSGREGSFLWQELTKKDTQIATAMPMRTKLPGGPVRIPKVETKGEPALSAPQGEPAAQCPECYAPTLPGPSPRPPQPLVLLTGLVVSLPRLPLLLRLPISVCELDCDIPSKKGLRQRSTARVSGHQGPGQQLVRAGS